MKNTCQYSRNVLDCCCLQVCTLKIPSILFHCNVFAESIRCGPRDFSLSILYICVCLCVYVWLACVSVCNFFCRMICSQHKHELLCRPLALCGGEGDLRKHYMFKYLWYHANTQLFLDLIPWGSTEEPPFLQHFLNAEKLISKCIQMYEYKITEAMNKTADYQVFFSLTQNTLKYVCSRPSMIDFMQWSAQGKH